MTALHEDLVIPQGKSWVSPLWALLGENNTGVELGSRVVRAQVRETPRDAQILHEWSTVKGNVQVTNPVTVTLTAEDGTTTVQTVAVALTVKPSESSAWAWRTGFYDVEITNPADPDDVWSVVETSSVRVDPEVTR